MSMKIRDIAREAGVSTATVSRVLNQPDRVLPETRENVLRVIRQANYVPNPLAKALSTGQTNLVAMVLPTLTNSVFAQMAEGCQEYLSSHQLNLVVLMGQRLNQNELDVLRSIDQRQVKGFIVSGSAFIEKAYGPILDQLRVPAVVIENLPEKGPFSCVYADDIQGFRDVTARFVDQGHRDIGVITGEVDFLDTHRRLQAIRDYLEDHYRHDVRLSVESAHYANIDSGRVAMAKLLGRPKPPTAVICLNDLLAFGALRGAGEAGLRVPKDLEITGYDDIPMASFSSPSLSTVRSPNVALGREAARLLLQQIDHPENPPEEVLLPVELVIRESSL